MKLEIRFTEKHGVKVGECSSIFVDDEHLTIDDEDVAILYMVESIHIDGSLIWNRPLPKDYRGVSQKSEDVYEKSYGSKALDRVEIMRYQTEDKKERYSYRDYRDYRPRGPFRTLDEAIDAWEMATEH